MKQKTHSKKKCFFLKARRNRSKVMFRKLKFVENNQENNQWMQQRDGLFFRKRGNNTLIRK